MSTAMPQVPPRPTRAQGQTTGGGSSLGSEMPKIPPRPKGRVDRSMSPHRESFARSPLNETPYLANHGNLSKSSLYSNNSANDSNPELLRRPSSVVMPSIGQEGNEYAEVFAPIEDLGTSPTQTRNIANDLKLHAPKASLPASSAKQRLSTVTRTDSSQAAAYGIGQASSANGSDDKDPSSRKLKERASFASQASATTERPGSSLESEHGIPEIGQQVPMYPNAGDVQAPSPAPFATPYAPGIGFHNDGSKPRHHARKSSARGEVPNDAYGRFGHCIPHQNDHFERAYYEKHPELVKKEAGQYGEGRAEWALSSDDLNKIVRNTASRGAGLGTSPAVFGTPTEEIGFQASEEYTSRISSPRPQSGYQVSQSAPYVDSPLRKQSFPADGGLKAELEGALQRSLDNPSNTSLGGEVEDEDTIHVDAPGRRGSKVYGAARYESVEDLRPASAYGTEDDLTHDERGYSAPILASDEVAKEPVDFDLQPAVSPLQERRGSYIMEDGFYHHRSGSDTNVTNSRPTSRPGSIHGTIPGLRLQDSTPLEDLDEYEPLFPEDEKRSNSQPKPLTSADRLKRPEYKNRKFPSQDIWEDTPNSLQYTATVSTPQSPDVAEDAESRTAQNETASQAFARRQEELAEQESRSSESFLHREHKKKAWVRNPELMDESRLGMKQRFPSRDIWEDTPDSLQLQTTVSTPQSAEDSILSPPTERPTTGAVAYHQEKAAAGVPMGAGEGRATTGIAATLKPQVPARPVRSKLGESPEKSQPVFQEKRPDRSGQAPSGNDALENSPPVPTKTKPQVPARPSKPITRESSEHVPLTTVTSNTSAKSVGSDQGSAAASKPKPPVPSRPVGSKIAALQSGFMSDLNKRLQLGPQAPKKDEPASEEQNEEKEKAPLADARKGRARGPARRAPAKSPTPATATAHTLGFSIPSTLWEIDPDEDELQVTSPNDETTTSPVSTKAAQSDTPTLARNTAGQSLHDASEVSPDVPLAPSTTKNPDLEIAEHAEKAALVAETRNDEHIPVKTSDDPPVKSQDIFDSEPTATSTATAAKDDDGDENELVESTATLKPASDN